MFKRKIVRMTQVEFDTMVDIMNTNTEAMKDADKRAVECCAKMHEYHAQLRVAEREKMTLVVENEHFKALFDKEADTQVIKYNGKLYRIASINHYKDGAEETLDISCVCGGEVK